MTDKQVLHVDYDGGELGRAEVTFGVLGVCGCQVLQEVFFDRELLATQEADEICSGSLATQEVGR